MSTLHLIYGPQGAGKSTHARNLAEHASAVHFAIDDWMIQLFGPDMLQPPNMEWVMTRVQRCEKRIWSTAAAILGRGGSVVLDIGLMKRTQREAAIQAARELGVGVQWHYVTAPLEVRRARVVERNSQKGATFSFEVSPAMFEMMEKHWEAPDEAELLQAQLLTTA